MLIVFTVNVLSNANLPVENLVCTDCTHYFVDLRMPLPNLVGRKFIKRHINLNWDYNSHDSY